MKNYPNTRDRLMNLDFNVVHNSTSPQAAQDGRPKPCVCFQGCAIRVYNADFAENPGSYFDPLTSADTPAEFLDWLIDNGMRQYRERAEDAKWARQIAARLGCELTDLFSGAMDGIFGRIRFGDRDVLLQRRGLGSSGQQTHLSSRELIHRDRARKFESMIGISPYYHSGVDHWALGDVTGAFEAIESPPPVAEDPGSAALIGRLAAVDAEIEGLKRDLVEIPDTPEIGPPRKKSNRSSSETVQPKEPAPMSTTAPKPESRLQQAVETVKTDATDAAWRTAGSQFVKLAREPLVGLLSRHLAPGDDALRGRIAAFLSTELGTALLSGLLSIGLSAMPQTAGPIPERIARELRVKAMAETTDSLADVLMGPLRQVMLLYLQDPSFAAVIPAEPRALDASNAPARLEAVREPEPVPVKKAGG